METWLVDVKRVRIPRPKFGSRYPSEPPKDYYDDSEDMKTKKNADMEKDIMKATEEIRRTLEEKL